MYRYLVAIRFLQQPPNFICRHFFLTFGLERSRPSLTPHHASHKRQPLVSPPILFSALVPRSTSACLGPCVCPCEERSLSHLPITFNCTLNLSSPSLLTALQVYVPESSAPTDAMVSSPFLSSAPSGSLEPSLSHMMLGVGMPDALHRNSTSSPSITV